MMTLHTAIKDSGAIDVTLREGKHGVKETVEVKNVTKEHKQNLAPLSTVANVTIIALFYLKLFTFILQYRSTCMRGNFAQFCSLHPH